jgi:hypothetical protein
MTTPAIDGAVIRQSLTHRFVLSSNDPGLACRASALLRDFAPPVRDPEADSAGGGAVPTIYSVRVAHGTNGAPCYTLDRDEQRVAATGEADMLLGQLLLQITSDTVEFAEEYLLVHAGAVVSPAGDAVVILGESGSGKTTLVAALLQEGFGYLSDEAAAIHLDTGLVHPWPRPLGFRHGSRSLARLARLFGPDGDHQSLAATDEIRVAAEQVRRGAIAGPCPVRYVVDHRYEPGAPTVLAPLSRAVALARMGGAAPRLRREGERGLAVLASVIRGTRASTLVGGELEQRVQALCAWVER